ncbi:MAG: c-type cytochrome [Mangrovicoccus sp.]|nr:c-type cytochrome [Mangrovicoccus sp.]
MRGLFWTGGAVLMTLGLLSCTAEPEVARREYATYFKEYCAACHGSGGRGNGPAAAGMTPRPTDLTRLSANNGGVFPIVAVMNQIDGYRSGPRAMPEFGAFLVNDRSVMVETAPGEFTPAPERLAGMADYIRTLQTP